jgi:hypothetical protein
MKARRHDARRAGSGVFVIATAIAMLTSGCDMFFGVAGEVVRCADDAPIEGARVRAVLLDGASDEEIVEARTDRAGEFSLVLNEPDTATVQVSFTADGFTQVRETYRGAPGTRQRICLEPAAMAWAH